MLHGGVRYYLILVSCSNRKINKKSLDVMFIQSCSRLKSQRVLRVLQREKSERGLLELVYLCNLNIFSAPTDCIRRNTKSDRDRVHSPITIHKFFIRSVLILFRQMKKYYHSLQYHSFTTPDYLEINEIKKLGVLA